MLNVFQNNTDKKKIVRYKTGFIKEQSGNTIPLKYYKLDREDIRRESYLKNVEMQSHMFIIRTNVDYKYTTNTRIIIDDIQYVVDSFYTEEQENANGIFRKRVKPFIYLVLKR